MLSWSLFFLTTNASAKAAPTAPENGRSSIVGNSGTAAVGSNVELGEAAEGDADAEGTGVDEGSGEAVAVGAAVGRLIVV